MPNNTLVIVWLPLVVLILSAAFFFWGWRRVVLYIVSATVIFLVGTVSEKLTDREGREKLKELNDAFVTGVENAADAPVRFSRVFYGYILNGAPEEKEPSIYPALPTSHDTAMRVVLASIVDVSNESVTIGSIVPSRYFRIDGSEIVDMRDFGNEVYLALDSQTNITTFDVGHCAFSLVGLLHFDCKEAPVSVSAIKENLKMRHEAVVAYATKTDDQGRFNSDRDSHVLDKRESTGKTKELFLEPVDPYLPAELWPDGVHWNCGHTDDVMAGKVRSFEQKYQVNAGEGIRRLSNPPPQNQAHDWPTRIPGAACYACETVVEGGLVSILAALAALTIGLFVSMRAGHPLAIILLTPVTGSCILWLLLEIMHLGGSLFGGVLAESLSGLSTTLPALGFLVSAVGKEREHHFTSRLTKWVERASERALEMLKRSQNPSETILGEAHTLLFHWDTVQLFRPMPLHAALCLCRSMTQSMSRRYAT